MERGAALNIIRRMLGDKMGYKIDDGAPDAEARAQAHAELPGLSAARQAAREAVIARREALFAADAEYQELVRVEKELRAAADAASYTCRRHKITVGTRHGLFFHVKAEGDSWEQVIQKLKEGAR